MTANRVDGRQLRLISTHFVRHAMRSGSGIFFVLAVVYLGLFTASMMLAPVEQIQAQSMREGMTLRQQKSLLTDIFEWKEATPYINKFLGSGPEPELDATDAERDRYRDADHWRLYLMRDNPPPLSILSLVLFYLLPLFIIVGAFNQFSSDVANKALRFQLLRSNRANLFFGRFLGTAVFTMLIMSTLIALVVVYMVTKLDVYEWGMVWDIGLRALLGVALLSFPYVALCQLVSCSVNSPFGSAILLTVIVNAVPVIAIAGYRFEVTEWMINFLFVLPLGLHHYFLHPDAGTVALAALGCVGYTIVYLFLGYWVFVRRDL